MKARVTDEVVRGVAGVLVTDLPIWCQGFAASPLVADLILVYWQEPIGSRAVAGYPGDAAIFDEDGATLTPAALLGVVSAVASQKEHLQNWIMQQAKKGVPLPGLYPSKHEAKAWNEETRGVGH